MIVNDLLKQSLRLARITLRQGRVASTNQLAEALTSANGMLGRWSANRLTAFQVVMETFSLVAGTKGYTIGPSGTWNTATRPQRIERANLLVSTDNRQPIEVIDVDHWADICAQSPTGQPDVLYNDRAAPASTLLFNYTPDQAYSVELYQWKAFARFAAGTDTVTFPPEYEEAIVYNLALRLASLAGTQVSQDTRDTAHSALADLESLNAPSPVMRCDDAVLGTHRGGRDYRTNYR